MNEKYFVWCMDTTLRLRDGKLIEVAADQSLDIYEDDEGASTDARSRYINGGEELLMVVKVGPFEHPQVLTLVGAISGRMAIDGYELRWAIEANLEALKQALLDEYTFVRRVKEEV